LIAQRPGLTIQQACKAGGISNSVLLDWREQHAELLPRLEEAREQARQKALAEIKAAGAKDWRAWEAFLKFSFWQDYRQNPSVQVNATATAQTAVVCSEEQRKRLIELREQLVNRKHELPAPNTNTEHAIEDEPISVPKRLPTNPAEPDTQPVAEEETGEGWGLDHPDIP